MDSVARKTTFKEAFCQYYHCPPEGYLQKALRRSFYVHALPVVLLCRDPAETTIRYAIEALEQAAEAENILDIHRAIIDYHYRLRMARGSGLVISLRIRLSGKRLLNLFARVSQQQTTPLPLPVTSRCS